jgi:hypothetical protein
VSIRRSGTSNGLTISALDAGTQPSVQALLVAGTAGGQRRADVNLERAARRDDAAQLFT